MTFPVYFHILGRRVHPHLVMEAIAYCAGFQTYLLLRRREVQTESAALTQFWIVVGAIFGALIGARSLAIVESWPDYYHRLNDPAVRLGAKTIVGGLLGGWIGVEIAKRILHIPGSTGDAYVLPILIGIAIGRVGCFLTGLPDHTYGTATNLPWGVDFGDGIRRHPTQLYEILAAILIGVFILIRMQWPYARGELFRWMLMLYLLFRLAVEFIKPTFRPYLGLSAIQTASLVGAAVCAWQLIRIHRVSSSPEPSPAGVT
jgi:prolipoprotein diacylglyceryltransferase